MVEISSYPSQVAVTEDSISLRRGSELIIITPLRLVSNGAMIGWVTGINWWRYWPISRWLMIVIINFITDWIKMVFSKISGGKVMVCYNSADSPYLCFTSVVNLCSEW